MPRSGAARAPPQAHYRANAGQVLKTFFTIRPRVRYADAMFMLATVAATAVISGSSPNAAPPRPVSATVRATASIRIISGATISWGTASSELPKMRLSQVRDATGAAQPIKLIEFE